MQVELTLNLQLHYLCMDLKMQPQTTAQENEQPLVGKLLVPYIKTIYTTVRLNP